MNTQPKKSTNRFEYSISSAGDGWYEYTVYRACHKTILNGGVVKGMRAARNAAQIEIRKLEGMQ